MTLRAADFRILNTQLIIFSQDPSEFSTNKFLAKILDKYAEIYDGDIQSLPIPIESFPAEIPRVILTNKEATLSLQVAPAFIRSSINTVKPESTPTQEEFIRHSFGVFKLYIELTNIKVNRLSLSRIRIQESNEAAKTLVDYFCKPELRETTLSKSEGFELHSYEKVNIDDLQLNLWTRAKTAKVEIDDIATPIIAIEQDINTPSGIDKTFANDEIEKYLNLFVKETQKTFEVYFPSIN